MLPRIFSAASRFCSIPEEVTTIVPARSPWIAAARLLNAAASNEFAPDASANESTDVIASLTPTGLANWVVEMSGGIVVMLLCSKTVMPRSERVKMIA